MRTEGIAAYASCSALALAATTLTLLSFRYPWLRSNTGNHIYLTKYCLSGGVCYEFPDKALCNKHEGFCAAWKTATFGLVLTICVDAVILTAIVFSWVAAHRKKVAAIVRYLAGGALVIDLIALQTFWTLYSEEKYFDYSWKLIKGPLYLGGASFLLLIMFVLMFFFRGLVKGIPIEGEQDSSDEEDDEVDTISIDEDLDEDQRDYYIFTKQARREALRGG